MSRYIYIYRGVWAVARPVIKAVYASLGPGARDTSTCPSDYGVLVAKADRPYRELNLILKQALKGVGRACFPAKVYTQVGIRYGSHPEARRSVV